MYMYVSSSRYPCVQSAWLGANAVGFRLDCTYSIYIYTYTHTYIYIYKQLTVSFCPERLIGVNAVGFRRRLRVGLRVKVRFKPQPEYTYKYEYINTYICIYIKSSRYPFVQRA